MPDELFLINRLKIQEPGIDDLRSWYAEEHIQEMIGLPGIGSARLLANTGDATDHLAIFRLTSADALTSDAYRNREMTARQHRVLDQLAQPIDRAVWRVLLAGSSND